MVESRPVVNPGESPYAGMGNNPVSYTDPLGLQQASTPFNEGSTSEPTHGMSYEDENGNFFGWDPVRKKYVPGIVVSTDVGADHREGAPVYGYVSGSRSSVWQQTGDVWHNGQPVSGAEYSKIINELVSTLSENGNRPPPVAFATDIPVAPGFWQHYRTAAYSKWGSKYGIYGGIENPWFDQRTMALYDNSQDVAAVAMGAVAIARLSVVGLRVLLTRASSAVEEVAASTAVTKMAVPVDDAAANARSVYIPETSLMQQRVASHDIPLPDPRAQGYSHTTLGGKIGGDGILYRQSATFPEVSWPLANGKGVPWSRVDWSTHGRPLVHPDPHQHIFFWNKTHWESGSAVRFPLY